MKTIDCNHLDQRQIPLMRTLILREPGQIELIQTEEPHSLAADQALVRVHSVEVCGTDIHAFPGRQPFFSYPRILGHELSVEIVELDSPQPNLKIGDRCAVEPYLNCGQCRACRRGKTNCCTSLQVLGVHIDGGMRELISLPVCELHRANELNWDQIALVETLGIGAHAVQRARLTSEDRVLIIGAGPIGLTVLQFCILGGMMPTIVDIDARRLSFCGTHLNAQSTIRIAPDDPQNTSELLSEQSDGDLFDGLCCMNGCGGGRLVALKCEEKEDQPTLAKALLPAQEEQEAIPPPQLERV